MNKDILKDILQKHDAMCHRLESLKMPYNKDTDKFYPVETSPEKEKEIMNAASSLLKAQQTVNTYFTDADADVIGDLTIEEIVKDCYEGSLFYWSTNNPTETTIRKDSIKKHISMRLKMWIDGKEF